MLDRDLVMAAFTELAPDYEPTVDRELRMFWGVSYRDFLAHFLTIAAVAEGEVLLDVATGTAFLPAQAAARVGPQGYIYGLDITPAMVARGAARLAADGWTERTSLICGSALAMPLADARIDAVLCALGTHHMDVPGLLSEMRRMLRPGGRIVLADVCANAFWRSLAGALLLRVLIVGYGLALHTARARAEIDAFENVRTANEWRALLAGHGYTDIALSEIRPRFPWYPGGFIARAVRPPG
jgi:ubiquinone/menaquinone biosynthesis C-methylase UbiE